MKIFVTLITMMLALACASGTNKVNHQSSAQTSVRDRPVGVGEVAPDFTLVDHNGNKVTLSEVRGKTPVVLVFYRGYW